jgi:hypothetical protein
VNATINLRLSCVAINDLINRDHVTSQKEHAPWTYLVKCGSSNEDTNRVNKFV